MNNRKGFTIIELLVVVGIIGLLASLAVVSFGSAQLRARDGKRVADMRAVISALKTVALTESSILLCNSAGGGVVGPTLISNVKICTGAVCGGAACTLGTTDVTANYIRLSILKDPSFGGTVCGAVPPVANCDYTMAGGPTMTGQNAVFSIGFVTESATPANLAAGNYHVASNTGMQ